MKESSLELGTTVDDLCGKFALRLSHLVEQLATIMLDGEGEIFTHNVKRCLQVLDQFDSNLIRNVVEELKARFHDLFSNSDVSQQLNDFGKLWKFFDLYDRVLKDFPAISSQYESLHQRIDQTLTERAPSIFQTLQSVCIGMSSYCIDKDFFLTLHFLKEKRPDLYESFVNTLRSNIVLVLEGTDDHIFLTHEHNIRPNRTLVSSKFATLFPEACEFIDFLRVKSKELDERLSAIFRKYLVGEIALSVEEKEILYDNFCSASSEISKSFIQQFVAKEKLEFNRLLSQNTFSSLEKAQDILSGFSSSLLSSQKDFLQDSRTKLVFKLIKLLQNSTLEPITEEKFNNFVSFIDSNSNAIGMDTTKEVIALLYKRFFFDGVPALIEPKSVVAIREHYEKAMKAYTIFSSHSQLSDIVITSLFMAEMKEIVTQVLSAVCSASIDSTTKKEAGEFFLSCLDTFKKNKDTAGRFFTLVELSFISELTAHQELLSLEVGDGRTTIASELSARPFGSIRMRTVVDYLSSRISNLSEYRPVVDERVLEGVVQSLRGMQPILQFVLKEEAFRTFRNQLMTPLKSVPKQLICPYLSGLTGPKVSSSAVVSLMQVCAELNQTSLQGFADSVVEKTMGNTPFVTLLFKNEESQQLLLDIEKLEKWEKGLRPKISGSPAILRSFNEKCEVLKNTLRSRLENLLVSSSNESEKLTLESIPKLRLLLDGLRRYDSSIFDELCTKSKKKFIDVHELFMQVDPLTVSMNFLQKKFVSLEKMKTIWLPLLRSEQELRDSMTVLEEDVKHCSSLLSQIYLSYIQGGKNLGREERANLVEMVKEHVPQLFTDFISQKDRLFKRDRISSLKEDYRTLQLLESVVTPPEIIQTLGRAFFQSKKEHLRKLLEQKLESQIKPAEEFQAITTLLFQLDHSDAVCQKVMKKIIEVELVHPLGIGSSLGEWRGMVQSFVALKEKYMSYSESPEVQHALTRVCDMALKFIVESVLTHLESDSALCVEMKHHLDELAQSFSPTENPDSYVTVLTIRKLFGAKFPQDFQTDESVVGKVTNDLLEGYSAFCHGTTPLSSHQLEICADILLALNPDKESLKTTIGRIYEDAAREIQKEHPGTLAQFRIFAKCAETIHYDVTHPMHALDQAVETKVKKASIDRAGVYFSGLDTSEVKTGSVHVTRKRVAENVGATSQDLLCVDFQVNHTARSSLADTLQAIEVRPELLMNLLPPGFCQGVQVQTRVPTVIRKFDETARVFTQSPGLTLGTETQIILEGVGTIRIPTDPLVYSMSNKIICEMEPDREDGSMVRKLNIIFSLLGLVTTLAPRRKEDEDRAKLLFLLHSFSPRLAFDIEREPETWTLSCDDLRQKIVKNDESMSAVFKKYLEDSPGLLQKVETVNGKEGFYIADMGGMLQKRGVSAFLCGMGGEVCNALPWGTAPDSSKTTFKSWFQQYVKRAWKNGRGVAFSSNAIRYMDQGSFSDGTSVSDDFATGGLDTVFTHYVPTALMAVPSALSRMTFCSSCVRLMFSPSIAGHTTYSHAYDTYGGRSLYVQKSGVKGLPAERYDERDSVIDFAEKMHDHTTSLVQNDLSKSADSAIRSSECMVRDVIPVQDLFSLSVDRPEMREGIIEVLREEGLIKKRKTEGDKEVEYVVIGLFSKPVDEFVFLGSTLESSMVHPWVGTPTPTSPAVDPLDQSSALREKGLEDRLREESVTSVVSRGVREGGILNHHSNALMLKAVQDAVAQMLFSEATVVIERYEKVIAQFHKELIDARFSLAGIDFSGNASLNRQLVLNLVRFVHKNHLNLTEFLKAIFIMDLQGKLLTFNDGKSTIAIRLTKALEDQHPIVLASLPLNVSKVPIDKFFLEKEYERLLDQGRATNEVLRSLYELCERVTHRKASSYSVHPSPLDSCDIQTCSELFENTIKEITSQHRVQGDSLYALAANYTLNELKSQTRNGFNLVTERLAKKKNLSQKSYMDTMSLDAIVADLASSSAGIDAFVSHLFWDRLHLLVGLGNRDVTVTCQGKEVPFRTLIQKLAEALDRSPQNDLKTIITRRQLQLRLAMIQEDMIGKRVEVATRV